MILDILLSQREAAELFPWSKELILVPQTSSGSTFCDYHVEQPVLSSFRGILPECSGEFFGKYLVCLRALQGLPDKASGVSD